MDKRRLTNIICMASTGVMGVIAGTLIVMNVSANNGPVSSMSSLSAPSSSAASGVSSTSNIAVSSEIVSSSSQQTKASVSQGKTVENSASTVDKSAQKNAEVQAENARYQAAVDAINKKYDPQIQPMQEEVSGYITAGVKDLTAELNEAQKDYDEADANYIYAVQHQHNVYHPISDSELETYRWQCTRLMVRLNEIKAQQEKYDRMILLQNNVSFLQSQKDSELSQENALHSSNLTQISLKY